MSIVIGVDKFINARLLGKPYPQMIKIDALNSNWARRHERIVATWTAVTSPWIRAQNEARAVHAPGLLEARFQRQTYRWISFTLMLIAEFLSPIQAELGARASPLPYPQSERTFYLHSDCCLSSLNRFSHSRPDT